MSDYIPDASTCFYSQFFQYSSTRNLVKSTAWIDEHYCGSLWTRTFTKLFLEKKKTARRTEYVTYSQKSGLLVEMFREAVKDDLHSIPNFLKPLAVDK